MRTTSPPTTDDKAHADAHVKTLEAFRDEQHERRIALANLPGMPR